MSRLIFLNPSVLGATIYPVPTPKVPFDSNACKAFVDLMNRVDDAAIIILGNGSPCLENLREVWEEEGLFGRRIIGIISSDHPVDHYLGLINSSFDEVAVDSIAIVDRVPEISYPERSILVPAFDRLNSDDVKNIVEILNRPFTPGKFSRQYQMPGCSQDCMCVCS